MKAFVDEQVSNRGFGTSSKYVQVLIRKDQERLQLRRLLRDGARSQPGAAVDGPDVSTPRDRIAKPTAT